VRYSWRQDAKWLAAILFVLCATVASFTYSLYRITLHQPATGVSAAVIEGMTGGALNDDLFAKLQAAARSNPEAEAQAEGVTIPLRGKEIADLSRDQLLQKSASRLADILYYEGVDAGEAYFQDLTPNEEEPPSTDGDPRDGKDEGLQLELLALFTGATHDGLRPFAVGLALVAAALLAVLVLLSRGFGRLGGPGIAIAIATGPFALVATALRGVLEDGQQNSEGTLAAAAGALRAPVADLASTFAVLAVIGLVMAALAVAGQVASVLVARRREARAATAAA